MTRLTTTACGKIMIAGEYAALFGYQALVMAIDRHAICTFTPSNRFSFSTKTISDTTEKNGHPIFVSAVKACQEAGFRAKPGTYFVDTSSFFDQKRNQKLGLGSSAAAMAALCKVIMLERSAGKPKVIFDIAFSAHRDFSSNMGSGADVAAAVFGGVISYNLNHGQPIINQIALPFLVEDLLFIDTGRAQNTRPFVRKVLELNQSRPDYVTHFCKQSSLLCDDLLVSRDIATTISVFSRLYDLLQSLGDVADIPIVSREHAQIYQAAKNSGGSAKPSGAGGGDICLAIVPKSHRLAFHKEILDLGFSIIDLRVDTREITV